MELNTEITELMRRIRWKVDQELTRRNIEPVFKDFYADKYDKEEFLMDVDFEFYKIKKLLDQNPRTLREDPILTVDYMKIVALIKQQKHLETTNEAFSSEAGFDSTWYDSSMIERTKKSELYDQLARYQKAMLLDGAQAGGVIEDYGEAMDINSTGAAVEEGIKGNKKKEAREHQKIMMQFDKLATAFQRKQGTDSTMKVAGQRGAPMVAETAGMLKKKNKVRKEKTLSAKLRLKDSKGN